MKLNFLRTFWTVAFYIIISVLYAQQPRVADIKKDVYFLASDSMEGRKPGTKGCDKSAAYIRDQFKAAGLQLLGDNGFQYFDVVTDIQTGPGNSLGFGGVQYSMDKDFRPFSFSSNSKVSATVVFVGYGFDFDLDTLKWHDYQGVDVKGKWVLMLRGNPEPENENSVFVQFSKERSKVLTAKDKGAAGVLFITGAGWDKNDELVNLYYDKSKAGSGIPVINIKRELANKIIAESNVTVEQLEAGINKERKSNSVSSSVIVSATTDLSFTTVRTQNVVAMLPGSDPSGKNDYLVIGAHYDHLGMGGPGSGSRKPDTVAVHNGADDNASGTSVLLSLARLFKAQKTPMKENVVFIAFGAEEMGMLGSSWFIAHPLVSLKNVTLMMNFDMVGRMDAQNKMIMVGGTGTFDEAVSILDQQQAGKNFKANYSTEGYGPSDHAAFYGDSIPVLYFNTGAHQDYHTPEDDADRINYEGMADIISYAYGIISQVAGSDMHFAYKEAGPKEKVSHGYGLKVRMGIMPDFVNTEIKGVSVGAVTKGGPADHGGLLKGDVIVALNGKTVENIYEYMDRMKTFSPGQTISVDILRGDKKQVFLIQL
jgi:aminopeptidase YwaD